ncbi:hypothetical protein [Rhabdochromatium marinum]|uniref:hypothetical protein n=1 Tax=Rhabdochromatium marinum TaxID=48729 RepID=UPI0019058FF1|nr:hypothetical protein [Rhabdochromatium marinum]
MMPTTMVLGYVDEDGNVLNGSGNFSVSEESEPGFYDIFFNEGVFSEQPIISGNCVTDSKEAPVFQIYQVNGAKGFVVETRNARSGERSAQAFMFIAAGEG